MGTSYWVRFSISPVYLDGRLKCSLSRNSQVTRIVTCNDTSHMLPLCLQVEVWYMHLTHMLSTCVSSGSKPLWIPYWCCPSSMCVRKLSKYAHIPSPMPHVLRQPVLKPPPQKTSNSMLHLLNYPSKRCRKILPRTLRSTTAR